MPSHFWIRMQLLVRCGAAFSPAWGRRILNWLHSSIHRQSAPFTNAFASTCSNCIRCSPVIRIAGFSSPPDCCRSEIWRAPADEILRYLPRAQIVTDHGAGWCPLVPYQTLATVLPIPEQHRNVRLWIEGSSAAAEVAQWLIENRNRLHWDVTAERFMLT
jgi:hypothetical protein